MKLDPAIAAIFDRSAPSPSIVDTDLNDYRRGINARMAAAPRADVSLGSVEDRTIDVGGHYITVRIYSPVGTGPFPVVAFYHSGGLVIGDLNMADSSCRAICSAVDAVVVSTDYRLAPEHPYPAAHEDAWAVLGWIVANKLELGGDGRLAVAGDSAGGNLSASMAIRARDSGLKLAAQVLMYPSTAFPDFDLPSFREFGDGPILTNEDILFYWQQYAPDEKLRTHPDLTPANAPDHRGLASAFVGTAECDPSRDLGEAYADLLRDAGVPTLKRRYLGMPHGFLNFCGLVPAAQRAMDEVCEWLSAQFEAAHSNDLKGQPVTNPVFEKIATATAMKAAVGASDNKPAVLAAPPPGTVLPITDAEALDDSLVDIPAPLLAAVIAHLTADPKILQKVQPYVKPVSLGGTLLPTETEAEIRAEARALLTRTDVAGTPTVSEGLLKEIMAMVAGEPVADEFVELMIDQMNFQPAGRFADVSHAKPPAGYRVGIVGAGLSGMAAAIKMSDAGYDVHIYEKSDEVGGVWWSNRYPGVAVDTPSHFYSYSFELNPDWPRYYSGGDVLRTYWKGVAAKYDIYGKTSFLTTVERCAWNEEEKLWHVESNGPNGTSTKKYNVLIMASGLFTHPALPKLPGLETFKGAAVHTAKWDSDLDVTGKRVIQIGTGASGVQVGPSIAPHVSHLTVFQRTAPWLSIRPAPGTKRPTSDGFRWGLRHIPHLAQWMRFLTYWNASDGIHPVVLVDKNWPPNRNSVNAMSERWYNLFKGTLAEKLQSRPDLLEKMTPNYPVMGKRLLQDSDWTDTMMRDNVELVTMPIERVVEDGVLDQEGRHYPADVLVLATGFALTKMMQHMEVVGRKGVTLRDLWGEEDPRSYLGTLVPGFPNLFVMHGPNSGANHGAGVNIYAEAQIDYFLLLLDKVIAENASTVEPSQDAHDRYNEIVDSALLDTVWNHSSVTTYYRNSKGRNFLSCPWRIVDFWHMMHKPEFEDLIVR